MKKTYVNACISFEHISSADIVTASDITREPLDVIELGEIELYVH